MSITRRLAILAPGLVALFAVPAVAQQAAAPEEAHEHAVPPPAPPAAPTGQRTPAPRDAYVYIGWPNDGEVIHSTRFKVWFGTRNFGVAPASTDVPDTGHHHLLIDTPLPPMDEAIPNDKHHLHFGLGQTETIIELPPGTHTLQLLMGDGHHIPHDPPVMSKRITIHVRAERGSETAGPTS
ncbi:MAG: DUF4399 domain-containing protein, partial [Acetobacteraceae bacterium]|nr:DUF4399 domain-containing protein [Acetobacteraceae bacterium]MBV8869515.1 DUF4399 domain-containing protein [Acetobacteraceae bacterium]